MLNGLPISLKQSKKRMAWKKATNQSKLCLHNTLSRYNYNAFAYFHTNQTTINTIIPMFLIVCVCNVFYVPEDTLHILDKKCFGNGTLEFVIQDVKITATTTTSAACKVVASLRAVYVMSVYYLFVRLS